MKYFIAAMILPIMIFFHTACANVRVDKIYDNIDPTFSQYVSDFIKLSNGKVKKEDLDKVTMGLKQYEEGIETVGSCHLYLYEVDISKTWWKHNTDYVNRQKLILHELGHCVLRRMHTDPASENGFASWLEKILVKTKLIRERGYLPDGCPASIMHSKLLSRGCVIKHYSYYIEELYNPSSRYIKAKGFSWDVKPMCEKPEVINKTRTWNRGDQWTFDNAKRVCMGSYKSCLKIFTKKAEGAYTAWCE